MKKLLILFAVFLGTIVLLCSCDCKHEQLSQTRCTVATFCLDCGKIISSAPGHTDGEWITDKEPTCTENGSKHQVCSVCETTIKTETLTKLGHTDGKWITVKEPTCTEDGSKYRICSVCNATETEALTKVGHTDGEWITDKEPTCTENGSKHQVCYVCKATIKTETLPFKGHNYQISSMENNGAVGSTITYTCTNCHDSYKKTVDEIVVSVRNTGTTSATINGYESHSKTYSVSASGGYGEFQYKFEVYTSATASKPIANLTKDFSNDASYGISYKGSEDAISGYILQITVKDEANNQTIYRYEL